MTMADESKGRTGIQKVKGGVVYLLAAILIAVGLYELYTVYTADYHDEWGFIDETYSAIIKIVMAEFILFDPKKNVLRAVGFYAISIGITRIIASFRTLAFVSDISLVIGGITLVMGVNILISGYNYLKDTTRGRTGMIAGTGTLAIMQTIMLMFTYESYRMTGVLEYEQIAPSVILLIQYVVLLLILDTEEVRYGTLMEKTNTRVESARVISTIEKDFNLRKEDADVILGMFEDRSSWESIPEGPIESEKRILMTEGRIQSWMILQKWKGSDDIHVTMANDPDGSIIAANRFSVHRVTSENDGEDITSVRLFSETSLIMQLAVERPKKKKKKEVQAQ